MRVAAPAKMPTYVPPMLAMLSELPSHEEEFAFEYKWDGYRSICYWDGVRLRFESRNKLDLTERYPELGALQNVLGKRHVILDGEIVAVGPGGKLSFGLLQNRMGWRQPSTQARYEIAYMIFDVLYAHDTLLTGLPYIERRSELEALKLSDRHWKTPPAYPGEGKQLLEAAKSQGHEGIMAKRINSPYAAGRRSGDWLKIKVTKRQEFVIGGWTPGEGGLRTTMGALLIGYYEPGPEPRLRYAGKVGTGFSMDARAALKQFFAKIPAEGSPFADPISEKPVTFVQPVLVGEVEFLEWTSDGKVRQGSFKGLRMDKKSTDVIREGL